MTVLLALILYLLTGLPLLRLIQLKEYFLPSIWAHFDYPSSWRFLFRPSEVVLALLWLIALFLSLIGYAPVVTSSFTWLFGAGLVVGLLLLKRRRLWRQLSWTPKFLLINLILLLLLTRIIGYAGSSLAIVFFLASRLGQFPLALIATGLANLATKIYVRRLFRQAKQKIIAAKKQNLRVIGLTGSYGKSGTKELLAQLLGTKFKVLRSPLRLNAEIGLAQFVLAAELTGLDFLVLELGTRGLGELKLLSDIFEPDLIFLTGLAPQHVGTIGSFAKIVNEKFSIFRSVAPGGIALLNGADPLIAKLNDRINVSKKYLYGDSGPFRAEAVQCSLTGSNFSFIHPYGQTKLETNLVAPHQLENLIGALAGCWLLGLKPETLKNELQRLTLLPHSYELRQKSDPLIIDDSYNANIVGVARGAEYFCSLPLERKVIIFAGILELGLEAPSYYRELIESFRGADDLLLTTTDFSEIFRAELTNKYRLLQDKNEFERFWSKLPKTNIGVLILGRVPAWIWTVMKL